MKILFNLLIFYMSSQTPLEHLKHFIKCCSLNVPSFLQSFTQVAFCFLLLYIMTKLIFLNISSILLNISLKYKFWSRITESEFSGIWRLWWSVDVNLSSKGWLHLCCSLQPKERPGAFKYTSLACLPPSPPAVFRGEAISQYLWYPFIIYVINGLETSKAVVHRLQIVITCVCVCVCVCVCWVMSSAL